MVQGFRYSLKYLTLALAITLSTLPIAVASAQDIAEQASIIVVDKSDRTVTLVFSDKRRVVLNDARFGSDWNKGPKRAQGDEKTPEGEYRVIDYRTSGSYKYLPALLINYPNQVDRAMSAALGVKDLGGDILIHGPPKWMPFDMHPPGNWTDGCVALSKKQLKLVMRASKLGTPVRITP